MYPPFQTLARAASGRIFLSALLVWTSASFALPQKSFAATHDLNIKVQLATQQKKAKVASSVSAVISGRTSSGWQELGGLLPKQQLSLQATAYSVSVLSLDGHPRYKELKITPPHHDGIVYYNRRAYRGSLHLVGGRNGFEVRNTLPLEKYLYSVVPSEMPASWPLDALKSQAVAARTYALVDLGRSAARGYDVASTTASQVYRGVKAEHPRSTQAVVATRGQVVTFQGQPIDAYFHSTSGGKTEYGGDLWANKPYLKPVKDMDQASPKYIWHTQFTQAKLQSLLRQRLGVNVGDLQTLAAIKRTRGGRVKLLRISGTQGSRVVKGDKIRSALKLNSTFFNVGGLDSAGKLISSAPSQIVEIPEKFEFAGRGWGHGMGMSQWGARQLALNGMGYKQILKHYYQGVNVKKIKAVSDQKRRYKIASR